MLQALQDLVDFNFSIIAEYRFCAKIEFRILLIENRKPNTEISDSGSVR